MDVIHFPDDPRPSRWVQPVLALGNFDGVHRGHRKILDRLHRVASERGATSVVMTFDPHPPRVVRPDKAPPLLMTKAQKLEAIAEAGVQGAAIVRFTPELSRWDPETFVRTVLVDWLRVSEVWVGANFLFGHDRAGNFSMLRDARRALRLQGGEDRSGPLQGLRRQQHARPAPGQRRARGRGRRAARPPVLPRRHRDARRSARPHDRLSDRESVHRERAAAAARRLRDDGDGRRRSCIASVTNIGTRPTVDESGRTVDRDAHLRPRPRSVRRRRSASASCSGCATSGRSSRWTLLRAQIDADCRRARVLFDRLSL